MTPQKNDNNGVTVKVTTSKTAIARDGGGVHLMVEVEPPAFAGDGQPVSIALVIDVSGSMSEPASRKHALLGVEGRSKLDYVKRAALQLLNQMSDADAMSLSIFSDDAAVVSRMLTLKGGRQVLNQAIRSLGTHSSTNIEAGLRAGLSTFNGNPGFVPRLVLLSDGMANAGITDPGLLAELVADGLKRHVTTSTLGVGIDYDADLMARLADAGGGEYHYIEDPAQLEAVFQEEFFAARTVQAREVRVTLVAPDPVAVSSNLNGYLEDACGDGTTATLGDLVRAKDVIWELTTPVAINSEALPIRIDVNWMGPDGEPNAKSAEVLIDAVGAAEAEALPANEMVVNRVLELIQELAIGEALAAYERGDRGWAVERLRQAGLKADEEADRYGSRAFGPQRDRVRAFLDSTSSGVEAGTLTQADAKRRHLQSRLARRRKDPGA